MYNYQDAIKDSKERHHSRVHVGLKSWARKDKCRPFGARNLYEVIRETEKAILVIPVDIGHIDIDAVDTFWAPKSTVVQPEE